METEIQQAKARQQEVIHLTSQNLSKGFHHFLDSQLFRIKIISKNAYERERERKRGPEVRSFAVWLRQAVKDSKENKKRI